MRRRCEELQAQVEHLQEDKQELESRLKGSHAQEGRWRGRLSRVERETRGWVVVLQSYLQHDDEDGCWSRQQHSVPMCGLFCIGSVSLYMRTQTHTIWGILNHLSYSPNSPNTFYLQLLTIPLQNYVIMEIVVLSMLLSPNNDLYLSLLVVVYSHVVWVCLRIPRLMQMLQLCGKKLFAVF